jgi:hypothetical protein
MGTQYMPVQGVLRQQALPPIKLLSGCACYTEGERPCRICLDYLKKCYVDVKRVTDLELLCAHGQEKCDLCFPKKTRKR